MLHPYFQFTEGVAVVADDAFEYGATIMRASITNNASLLVDSATGQGGTLRSAISGATIMKASPVNGRAIMSDSAINNSAGLL